jgi:hypothetical protein
MIIDSLSPENLIPLVFVNRLLVGQNERGTRIAKMIQVPVSWRGEEQRRHFLEPYTRYVRPSTCTSSSLQGENAGPVANVCKVDRSIIKNGRSGQGKQHANLPGA